MSMVALSLRYHRLGAPECGKGSRLVDTGAQFLKRAMKDGGKEIYFGR